MKILEIKKYAREIKPYIMFSSLIFIFAVLGGYFFAQNFPQQTEEIMKQLQSLFSPAKEEDSLGLFIFILENNITKLLAVLILGIFAGLIPLASVFINGMLLGIFAYVVSERLSWPFLVAGILPHGIFEIPALILSTAIGIRVGEVAVRKLFGRKEKFMDEFAKGLQFFISVVVPILFLAALIETYVTSYILSFWNI